MITSETFFLKSHWTNEKTRIFFAQFYYFIYIRLSTIKILTIFYEMWEKIQNFIKKDNPHGLEP